MSSLIMEHTFKAYNMCTLNYRTKNLTTDCFNKIISYKGMPRHISQLELMILFFIADITIWFKMSHFWEML